MAVLRLGVCVVLYKCRLSYHRIGSASCLLLPRRIIKEGAPIFLCPDSGTNVAIIASHTLCQNNAHRRSILVTSSPRATLHHTTFKNAIILARPICQGK
jgi:hypothetical protein